MLVLEPPLLNFLDPPLHCPFFFSISLPALFFVNYFSGYLRHKLSRDHQKKRLKRCLPPIFCELDTLCTAEHHFHTPCSPDCHRFSEVCGCSKHVHRYHSGTFRTVNVRTAPPACQAQYRRVYCIELSVGAEISPQKRTREWNHIVQSMRFMTLQ